MLSRLVSLISIVSIHPSLDSSIGSMWDGKCPDRIKRKVLKNSYKNGGMKAPDMRALDCGLKVKQYMMFSKSRQLGGLVPAFRLEVPLR